MFCKYRQLTIVVGMLLILAPIDCFASREQSAEGKIVELVPSKREIYVATEEGKNEYYFNDRTRVTQNGQEKQYSDLKEGMKVRVEAQKIGKRLDPVKVEILE